MNKWNNILQDLGVIWKHDGNPNRPYAKLTSGLHSNGFVNMTKLTEHPCILMQMCEELSNSLTLKRREKDYIVGSAMGSIVIASNIAFIRKCRTIYTEKYEDEMKFKRFTPEMSSIAILAEDVLTTGSTTLKTKKECLEYKLIVPNVVLCLINRSGKSKIGDLEIISVLDLNIDTWEPKENEVAVRPKENWGILTQNYD